MRHTLTYLFIYGFLSIILWMLPSCAKHSEADNSASSGVSLDSALNVLNMEMKKREDYRRNKEERLKALKLDLRDSASQLNFKVANELFDEYKAYQSDSAYKYAFVMNEIAEETALPELQTKTNNCRWGASDGRAHIRIASSWHIRSSSRSVLSQPLYKDCLRLYDKDEIPLLSRQ